MNLSRISCAGTRFPKEQVYSEETVGAKRQLCPTEIDGRAALLRRPNHLSASQPARQDRLQRSLAFSLLEMLIVVAMLLIMTVLVGNRLGVGGDKNFRECQANLQKISVALNFYKNDNNGAFPVVAGATSPSAPLSLLVPKSTTVTEMFICPGSKDDPLPEAESFSSRKISYAYYMGRATNESPDEIIVSDAQVDSAPKNKGQAIFSPDGHAPGNNHGKKGGNLLTLGGEVVESGPAASRDFRFPPQVRLLNPQ